MALMPPCPQQSLRERLSALVQEADLDGAIEAGLIEFAPCPAPCCMDAAPLLAAQAQLRNAWAARERYRGRQLRLQARAEERQARRSVSSTPAAAPAATPAADGDVGGAPIVATSTPRPALPASAAAILARAKAKAAGRPID